MKEIYDSLKLELKKAFKKIRLIATDFDGVLTDNRVIHHQNGTEAVIRSRVDSQGIDLLFDAGLYNKSDYKSLNHEIDIVIMSRETNPVVKSVSDKIKIKCLHGKYDKITSFEKEVKKRNLDYSQVLYMGNDFNDINCIKKAGIGVAVNDAVDEVKKIANYITQHKGGNGAFREICELSLYAKNKHPFP